MLVIFGASGRSGRAVLEEAIRAGIPVRPVVRDDREARTLDDLVDVDLVRYADPARATAIPPVLEGADAVVSCLDPRNLGPEVRPHPPVAGANILRAAVEAGVERVVHLSVMGAYRWSPNPLNRASFHMDRGVWVLKELPWSMLRPSCFFDEVIEAHVRPPDGGRPHPVPRSGRTTPMSRRDLGRMVIGALPRLLPGRVHPVGGPRTYTGEELAELVAPYVHPGERRRRTRRGPIPPGDVSVSPELTWVGTGVDPVDRLEDALAPPPAPARPAVDPTVYPREAPPPHPADEGRDLAILRRMGPDLRRVVHAQLVEDLARLGHDVEGVRLDFRRARPRRGGRKARAHGGEIVEMTGVRAVAADGSTVRSGPVRFLRDEFAEELRVWWDDGEGALPERIWRELDLGVRRRLTRDPAFRDDPKVRAHARIVGEG